MALVTVIVPLTGMVEMLTGPQFSKFVETSPTSRIRPQRAKSF